MNGRKKKKRKGERGQRQGKRRGEEQKKKRGWRRRNKGRRLGEGSWVVVYCSMKIAGKY